MHSLAPVFTWVRSNPWWSLLIVYVLGTHAVGALPAKAQRLPIVGFFVRVFAGIGYLLHSDTPGTLTWPFVGAQARAAGTALLTSTPAAGGPPPVPRDAQRGCSAVPVLAVALLLVLGLCGAVLACSSTAAQRNALAVNTTATAFNGAEHAMLDAEEVEGRHAIDAACTPSCTLGEARAASAGVERRWSPVWVAYESARLAHDTWRQTSEACGTSAGGCSVDPAQLAVVFVERVGAWRCSLRALGQESIDPLGSTGLTCGATDGGAP